MNRRDEWSKRVGERKHTQDGERVRALKVAAMSEVPAAQLAHSDGWHLFQQTIQSTLDSAIGELSETQSRMFSPGVVSVEDMMTIKIRVAVLSERVDVLKAVIDLPKSLQENARAAKQWLERDEWRKQDS
ncbi:MAG TPA: hypothetical protein VNA25_25555 [Phycisphaerae bacterium]|nr:hypothetical protein [Phycisphaerae bacterium]